MSGSLTEQLRALLNRYTQPCDEDCNHSQCPLLRELHALHVSHTLEQARLAVKPIVDREREGEFVGDLMNMRLQAEHVIETVAATRQSPLWNREGYDAALSATLGKLRAPTPPETPVVAREIAHEIADRWARHELPVSAGIHSNPTLQLRALAEFVITRYLVATPLPETPPKVCVKCGHAEGVDAVGTCLFGISDTDRKTWDCGCKCEFAAPVVATDDVEGETQTAMKPGDTVRFVRDGEQYTATIISFAPRVFGGAGCNIETTRGWVLRDDIDDWTPAAALRTNVEGEK